MQTLLLAFSILLLVCVLYILGLSGNQFHSSGKSTMEEDFIGEKKR